MSRRAEVAIRPYSEGDLPWLERTLGDPRMMKHLGGPEGLEKLRERHKKFVAMSEDSSAGCMFVTTIGSEKASAGFWDLGLSTLFLAGATGGAYSLWSQVLLEPYMAANSPSLEDGLSTNNGYITTFLIISLTFVVGYLVFSVAVVRARVLPRWGLWLIVLQIIGLASLFGSAIAFAAFLIFTALLGLGIAGWGYAILSTQKTSRKNLDQR